MDIIIPSFDHENFIWTCSAPSLQKHAYILGRPIEISALETFKVTIDAPSTLITFILECVCDSRVLFQHGCQCGFKEVQS